MRNAEWGMRKHLKTVIIVEIITYERLSSRDSSCVKVFNDFKQ